MYKVKLNDKIIEHNLQCGDRVSPKGKPKDTGTVDKVTLNGIIIEVDWDEHCKNRLGKGWLPSSLVKELVK